MCGINGLYSFSGNHLDGSIIRKMNQKLEHRGPDAEGVYEDKYVSLGHKRLSIIDLSDGANQPFKSEDGRYVLVFNGEIYNFKEIKDQLFDYNFKTESDTEVVMAAFLKWGEKCLRSFNGMFAFAIWDTEKKEMFLARDRMGIKPLYYVISENEIIFSSSLRSILSTELIARKISKDSLVDYLRYQTVHAPFTIIEGVFMMLPGQQLRINEEGSVFKTYWDPTLTFRKADRNYEDVKKEVRSLLEKSVEQRMVADVPFGAFLSGGIDSSIIVALMSKLHPQKVNTFSVVFKENEFSEAKYAREIAKKYNTIHHEIELSVNEFKELIPEALSFMDHPSGDGPNTYVVSKKTKEAGIKMALSGLGGDELFGGYSIFNQIPELQSKKWLSSFPVYARKPMANLYHKLKGSVESSKIKEILKLSYFDTEFIYQFYRQVLMDDQIESLLNSKKLPKSRVFKDTHERIGYKTSGWNLPPLSRISVSEFSTYMQNVLLRDSDQMSMANGLELRVPFLDHELVEYTLGINDQFKRPVTPKKLLVDACKDLIPESIYNRPKMGFVLPYKEWMKGELKDFCEENLNGLKKIEYFNALEIDNLWSKFLAGNARVTWSRVWPMVVLGHWIITNNIED